MHIHACSLHVTSVSMSSYVIWPCWFRGPCSPGVLHHLLLLYSFCFFFHGCGSCCFLNFFLSPLSFVYILMTIDFCAFIWYSDSLLKMFISYSNLLVKFFGSIMYTILYLQKNILWLLPFQTIPFGSLIPLVHLTKKGVGFC